MQWFLNLVYYFIDLAMQQFDGYEMPYRYGVIVANIYKYSQMGNYYFPLDTLAEICLKIVGFTILCVLVYEIKRRRYNNF